MSNRSVSFHHALLAVCAACSTSPGTAHVQLDLAAGWTGTAEVLAHDPTGALVSRAPITASLDVAVKPGDTVTVATRAAGLTYLESTLAVAPGDVVEVDVAPPPVTPATSPVPIVFPITAATSWTAASPFDNQWAQLPTDPELSFPLGMTTFPIVAATYGDSGPLAMYGDRDVTIDNEDATTIDLTADAIPWQADTITMTNAPETAWASVDVNFGANFLYLGAPSNVTAIPTGLGDSADLGASGIDPSGMLVEIDSRVALPAPAATTFDLAAPDLPQVSALAIGSGEATWQLAGGSDYKRVYFGFESSTDSTFAWDFAGPPGTDSVALPQLPSDYAPPAFDELGVSVDRRSDLPSYVTGSFHYIPLPIGAGFELRNVSSAPPGSARRAPVSARSSTEKSAPSR
jgi:hypothetical protein